MADDFEEGQLGSRERLGGCLHTAVGGDGTLSGLVEVSWRIVHGS